MIRFLARAAAVLAVALLLLAMQRTTPGYTEITGPIVKSGTVGSPVEARSFRARVSKVVLAERLVWQARGASVERSTTGLWAVVVARLEADPVTTSVAGALWQGPGGLLFEASQRVAGAPGLLTAERLEPGLPRDGILVFEVARQEARGATLLLSQNRWPRLDSQLAIAIPPAAVETAETLALDGPL